VQVTDAAGQTLYQRFVPCIGTGESEPFPESSTNDPVEESAAMPGRGRALVVKIPRLPTAESLIITGYRPEAGPDGHPSTPIGPVTVPVKDLYRLLAAAPREASGEKYHVKQIVHNGDDCWDLVILSEAFQDNQMTDFAKYTQEFVDYLQITPPFDELWSKINIYRVDVISPRVAFASTLMHTDGTTPFRSTYNKDQKGLMDMDTKEAERIASKAVRSGICFGDGKPLAVMGAVSGPNPTWVSSHSDVSFHSLEHGRARDWARVHASGRIWRIRRVEV
jgi:hypothetical protein